MSTTDLPTVHGVLSETATIPWAFGSDCAEAWKLNREYPDIILDVTAGTLTHKV